MGYAIIYKTEKGEDPAEILQVVNNQINGENWTVREGISYTNCADRATLETELTNLDATWENDFEVRYYKKIIT